MIIPIPLLMRRLTRFLPSARILLLDGLAAVVFVSGCSSDTQSDTGGGGGSSAANALPGAEGGECVGGDLCDYGLVCVDAVCVPGDRGSLGGGPTAAGGVELPRQTGQFV